MAKEAGPRKTQLAPPPPNEGKFKKFSALEDGQSVTGQILGFPSKYSEQLKKDMTTILLKTESGQFEYTPAGTINDYLQAGELKIGRTYEFRKSGVTRTKKGGYKNNFVVSVVEYPSTDSDI